MSAYYADDQTTLYHGDSLAVLSSLPDASVDCCVTSPPYFGLRDYGVPATDWPEVTYAPVLGMREVTVPAMTCPLGMEPDPLAFVAHLRLIFAEARRVLTDDGTLWLNIGDSYNAYNGNRGASATGFSRNEPMPELPKGAGLTVKNLAPKNMLGIPWRTAFALQDDGWILRNDVIWSKPNAMPESVTDRLSCRHEHLFMFSKSRTYWFDLDPIREPLAFPDKTGHAFGGNNPEISRTRGGTYGVTWEERKANGAPSRRGIDPVTSIGDSNFAPNPRGRNPGDVWAIATQPFAEAHFAVMPQVLAERAIQAGCKPGGTVLDPFSGSGTSGLAAAKHGRRYVGIDLSSDYLDLSLRTRLAQPGLDFGGVT